jgi:cullin 3
LTGINTKEYASLEYEDIYRLAYKIVLMMRAPDLYEKVKQLEQHWLQTSVQTIVRDSISASLIRAQKSTDAQDQSSERREEGEKFLTALKVAWEDYQFGMGMVADVLLYMVCFLEYEPC